MEKKDIKLLRELLNEATRKSNDVYQLYSRMIDIIDYLGGTMTPSFNDKIKKEYKVLKENN